MARAYTVTFEQVLVAAAQDLVQINGAAGKLVRIKRIWWGSTDTTPPVAQMLSLRARFLPATVTNGNGSAVTPQKLDPGDAAASATALANSTTKAATTGTAAILEENGAHVYTGYDYTFPQAPVIGPSEAFVFELLSTPSGTLHLSGGVTFEEAGG